MSLLDSIGRPKWEHSDPAVRREAITSVEDMDILFKLVTEDSDDVVRSLALARIDDPVRLDELMHSLGGDLQQQARTQRLEMLLPDPDRLDQVEDQQTLLLIAGLTDDPALMEACVGRLDGLESRMAAAQEHPVARVRLCAAQSIEDSDALHELMNKVRHKDKSVYRHCKDMLDRVHAQEREAAERQAGLDQLASDAEALAAMVDSPEYKGRFQTLNGRWESLSAHADEKLSERIENDLAICRRRVEQADAIRLADEEKQAESEQAQATFEDLIAELGALEVTPEDLASPEAIDAFQKRLDGMEDRWLAAGHHAQPSAEQFKNCKERLKHWRTVARSTLAVLNSRAEIDRLQQESAKVDKSDFVALQKLDKQAGRLLSRLSWPEGVSLERPGAIGELEELRAALEEKTERLKRKEEKNLERVEQAFQELRTELDDAHFKNADRVMNRLRNLLRRLQPHHQRRFQDELKPLTARLREIHDWQGFAIEPKKVELCDRMRALIGIDENPDALAAKIKELQQEWKKLGPVSPRRDQALWKKFSTAADQAYEPCREAFARQAEQRRENYRMRMQLIDQLVDYEKRIAWPDAENPDPHAAKPDWRKVQKTLDTARDAFNRIKPVDRKGERKSRKALKTVCDRIYSHIRLEYERNITLKKNLVARAKELVELEDLKEAINQAKSIQQEWKQAGITPRQVDRRLWKDFRAACDAVFARLDGKRAERKAAAEARDRQRQERKKAETERWTRLRDRLLACALKADDPEKAESLWTVEGGLPKGVESEALEGWWLEGPDADTPEESVRETCIAYEILHDQDSPPEDKEVRMAYQMQRLVEGLGGQRANRPQQQLDLINALIAQRPGGVWVERFCSNGKLDPLS